MSQAADLQALQQQGGLLVDCVQVSRAVLVVLEQIDGSLEGLGQQGIYLVEALTGFALWLRRRQGEGRLICSEFLVDVEQRFIDASFDLVLCNELFEHVQDPELAFREIARVPLRCCGTTRRGLSAAV